MRGTLTPRDKTTSYILAVAFLILLAGLIAASLAPGEVLIRTYHDPDKAVTCWIYKESALSCIPDSQLRGQ